MNDIKVSAELQDLDELERLSNEELEEESKLEKEIEEYKNTISTSLLAKKSGLTINIDGRMFAVGYKIEKTTKLGKTTKQLVFIAIDIMMAKLSNRKKGQTTIKLDYVDCMSLKSNLVAASEAWLRHMTGTIKASDKNE